MINKVFLVGNLTHDPELRATPSGMSVMMFSIAVNDRRKDANGEYADNTNYFDCTMFGERARALHGYLAKGAKVCVEGRLRWQSWEKDGQRRSKVDVVVDDFDFMSKSQPKPSGNPPRDAYSDADIPF